MGAREGAGRNSPRAARGLGAGRGDDARGGARRLAASRQCGADRAGGRRRRDARALRGGRQRRAMVRPAAAGAHPSLHDQPAARRDRAGRARATSCASCSPGIMSTARRGSKGRIPFPSRSRCSKASRRRPSPGRRKSCRRGSNITALVARRAMPGRPHDLDAADAARRPPPSATRSASPVPATPIALVDRRKAPLWLTLAPAEGAAAPSASAQALLDAFTVAWRAVLRRAWRSRPHAALAGRGGSGRTGGARARRFGFVRGPARAAHAVEPAQAPRRAHRGAGGFCRSRSRAADAGR